MGSGDRGPWTALGAILVVLGGLVLLGQVAGFRAWGSAWPLFVIVPGVLMLAASLAGSAAAALAVPGAIVTTVGLVLLVQQTFDLYQTWAYAWALVAPTAVGVGLSLAGLQTRDARLRRRGGELVGLGLLLFVLGAAFFELVIGLSGFGLGLGPYVFPLVLIGLGVLLLLGRGLAPGGRRP